MKIEEAIAQLLEMDHPRFVNKKMTKFYIAKKLDVTPVMIDKWTKLEYNGVSEKVVNNFLTVFGIELSNFQSVMYIENGTLKASLM